MENFNLDKIKKFFPLTDKATDSQGLITAIIAYVIVAVIGGLIIGFIPIVGGILGALIELWFVIGILLSLYTYFTSQGSGSNGGEQ